jgi:hypothetical protein
MSWTTSVNGTKPTSSEVHYLAADRGKAEIVRIDDLGSD